MPPANTRAWTACLLLAGFSAGLLADRLTAPRVTEPAFAQLTPPRASAQGVPDPAQQQIVANEILKAIDQRLARIQGLLESGELRVKLPSNANQAK